MNKALKNILERNSHRNLVDPIPSKDEMEQVYQAALRAPDHAWVRPSSFIRLVAKGLKNSLISLLKLPRKVLKI